MSIWELIAALFGVVGVYLTARENVWCWPIGLVNVAIYILVFWRAKLYADTGLQVVYVALCLYGWWAWLRGGRDHSQLEVRRAPLWALLVGLVAGVAVTCGLGSFLHSQTDAALPYWDAGTTAFSLVAQWFQTRKWIENWIVWVVVDLVYLPMYLWKSLPATTVLYAIYLILAVVGWRAWRRAILVPSPGVA